ncbi:MAG TPA: effector binding domain-containing protein [Caldisericia bacterium]|nr:effector binding domain-containing protein [Caldisericia bacterium]HOC78944.1 effector binding domain-containing protein [Caldisericia bacterium]HOG69731.1 effector binding domain-containing protein [Caldisericia bacterium]HPA65623.1 effector binding domain-containing protein [Caldisericia bacterium]HPM43940.1 effector binding domain-containing protein [Caldisericia bacterium]
MMNSFERIQKVIDYIEENLTVRINPDTACSQSGISTVHCYRMFHMLVGRSLMAYVRTRRMTEAAKKLRAGHESIIELALDCEYDSQEAFTRAFKSEFGVTPGTFRQNKPKIKEYNKVDLIEKYYDDSANSMQGDPKVKVLKWLPPIRVAYCNAIGKTPEKDAWNKLLDWAATNGLFDCPYRLFGFNNPSPQSGKDEYGYEVCITVEKDVTGTDEIKFKHLMGGHYAVMGTTLPNIEKDWKHFSTWLSLSKYEYGTHQCLEEHLTPPDRWDNETLEIDLYMPIKVKEKPMEKEIKEIKLDKMRVAHCRALSASPENDSWKIMKEWVTKNGILDLPGTKIFGFDNPCPEPDRSFYGFEHWVTVPDDVEPSSGVGIKEVEGGDYLILSSRLEDISENYKRLFRGFDKRKIDCREAPWIQELIFDKEDPDNQDLMELVLYAPFKRRN